MIKAGTCIVQRGLCGVFKALWDCGASWGFGVPAVVVLHTHLDMHEREGHTGGKRDGRCVRRGNEKLPTGRGPRLMRSPPARLKHQQRVWSSATGVNASDSVASRPQERYGGNYLSAFGANLWCCKKRRSYCSLEQVLQCLIAGFFFYAQPKTNRKGFEK